MAKAVFQFPNVTNLNEYANNYLLSDSCLLSFSVSGEISNFKCYPSGHCYFSLKDDKSSISCVMFRFYASMISFSPKDGDKVDVYGSAEIYSASGKFQIKVTSMRPKGSGDIKEQYRALVAKLSSEGLFDDEYKKELPMIPRRIGVITSNSGSVIHDIVQTLNRRNPHFDLLLYPCTVQGQLASMEVCEALDFFENDGSCDVIIIARGGGSDEDLYCFNDEALARRIFKCNIPIVSAIGHEDNVTICDKVSDRRVSTPTAAAEIVLSKYEDLNFSLANLNKRFISAFNVYINNQRTRILSLRNDKALSGPQYSVKVKRSQLDSLISELSLRSEQMVSDEKKSLSQMIDKLNRNESELLLSYKFQLKSFIDRIESMGPLGVLKRGYSFVTDEGGNSISSVDSIESGKVVGIRFSNGTAKAQILSVDRSDDFETSGVED